MFEDFHTKWLTDPRMLARLTVRERGIIEGRLPCNDLEPEEWFWNEILLHGETVLTVSWDGHMPGHSGAVWYRCWRGIFYGSCSDMDPEGPYDTLDEAMQRYGAELYEAYDVYCDVLPEDELIALVTRHLARDAHGVAINDKTYVVRNGVLVPEETKPA